MLQEKTAWMTHTLGTAGGSARFVRSHVVRTYIAQVGCLFSFFDMLYVCTRMYERNDTGQQPRRNSEMKWETGNIETFFLAEAGVLGGKNPDERVCVCTDGCQRTSWTEERRVR